MSSFNVINNSSSKAIRHTQPHLPLLKHDYMLRSAYVTIRQTLQDIKIETKYNVVYPFKAEAQTALFKAPVRIAL